MTPGHWRIAIFERDHPSNVVRAWLGNATPTPSEGGGGWESVTLPNQRPVTVWRGGALMVMNVTIVLDGLDPSLRVLPAGALPAPGPVADDYRALLRFWRPLEPTDEPPPVKIDTLSNAVPFQNLDWIVTGLEWGDALADENMTRTQQELSVTFTEYRAEEHLDAPTRGSVVKKRKAKKRQKTKHGPRLVVVKSGETLTSIAAKHSIRGGWRELGNAQKPPITDPRNVHVGQRLRLP